jgi:protocatechuate 3,4-dioxygenase beta subunit
MFKHGFSSAAALTIVFLLVSKLAFGLTLTVAQAETSPSTTEKKPKLVSLWQPGDAGERMNIRGRVSTVNGTPLSGISISIRQADGNGDYQERYSATLKTDQKGRYQFGSVVPGNYMGVRHIHIWVYQDGYQYYDSRILFKGDPHLNDSSNTKNAVFLEESTVNGETILFGRFDIVLTPN